jgi:hypothetical protein
MRQASKRSRCRVQRPASERAVEMHRLLREREMPHVLSFAVPR